MTAGGVLNQDARSESDVAVPSPSVQTPQSVTPITIARYLVGDRQAIKDVFASRQPLILSGVFGALRRVSLGNTTGKTCCTC